MNYDYVLRILTVQVTTNLKKAHLLTLVFFAIYSVVLTNSESYKSLILPLLKQKDTNVTLGKLMERFADTLLPRTNKQIVWALCGPPAL